MINKFIPLTILLFFTVNVFSQKKVVKQASKITDQMAEVLSLDEDEKAEVYEIQLNRFQLIASIRETYKNDSKTRKSELKKVYRKLFGKLNKVLDKEKMQSWKTFRQTNKNQ